MEIRHDEADTIFFSRDLEQRKAQAYEKKYPELRGRLIVPTVFDYDPGVEVISYEMHDMVGVAKLIENYATDFRRVDVSGSEHTAKVKSFGASIGVSFQDLRRARLAGKPIEQRKFNAARRALLLVDDDIIAFGDADLGFVGILNHPNIPDESAIDIGGGVTEWENKTGEQMVDDCMLGISTVRTQSNNVEAPNALVLPPSRYTLFSTKRMAGIETTALEYFLKKQKWVTSVEEWHHLEEAGAGDSARALFYKRDVDYLEHPVPQDFETPVPPQWKGGELETLFHERCGGVIVRYPLSALYLDEI